MKPYQRTKNSTSKLEINIIISLLPLLIYNIYKYDIKFIIPLLICIFTSCIIETIYISIFKKEKGILNTILNSYIFLPGLLIPLILPIGTSTKILLITTTIASLSKVIFGGNDKYFINPVALSILLISLIYGYQTFNTLGYNNSYYVSNIIPVILIILGYIYLTITNTIKWRIPITILIVISIMTIFIGVYNELPYMYVINELLKDSLLFSIIYLATDNGSSPLTPNAQIIYGIIIGASYTLLHYFTNLNSAHIYAILLVNLFVPIIDKIGIKNRLKHNNSLYSVIILTLILAVITVLIGYASNNNIIKIH